MRTGKVTNRNILSQALDEMETFGLGAVKKKKVVPKKKITKRTTTKYRPRSPAEVKAQNPVPQKGIIEKTLQPIINLAIVGLGAFLAVQLIPVIIGAIKKEKPPTT